MRATREIREDSLSAPGRSARADSRREREPVRVICRTLTVDIPCALKILAGSPCVMTAAFEFKRSGILIARVMQCADVPPCIAIATPKGHRLSTLIRDSRAFSVNVIDLQQRLIIKKFTRDDESDPFDVLETRTLVTGAPAILKAKAAIDCEVMRHFDLESDFEMYVGQVLAAKVFDRSALGAEFAPMERLGGSMPGVPQSSGHPGEDRASSVDRIAV